MKQYYCFLGKFNNYFNRKIIKFESLSDYQDNSESFFIPEDADGVMLPFDFNPNDNVTTEIIANNVPFDPDYFLLMDEDQNIVQRWFILEQRRNRNRQWTYQLRRDVIADNINNLLQAPIFIEKGKLQEDDPMIVNDEGCSFNKIKTEETLLKDETGTAWAVAYVSKDTGGEAITAQSGELKGKFYTISDIAAAIGTTQAVLASLLNLNGNIINVARFTESFEIQAVAEIYGADGNIKNYPRFRFNQNSAGINVGNNYEGPQGIESILMTGLNANPSRAPSAYDAFKNSMIESINANSSAFLSQVQAILGKPYYLSINQYNLLLKYQGKYVYYNGKYYKMSISAGSVTPFTVTNVDPSLHTSLLAIVNGVISRWPGSNVYTETPAGPVFYSISAFDRNVIINLDEKSATTFIPQIDVTISSGRNVTEDQDFDIIAIPYGEVNFNDGNGDIYTSSLEHARRIMSQLALQLDAKCFDVQLLPYCPVELNYGTDGQGNKYIDLDDMTEGVDFDYITKNSSNIVTVTASLSETLLIVVARFPVSIPATSEIDYISAPIFTPASAKSSFFLFHQDLSHVHDASGYILMSFLRIGSFPLSDLSIDIEYTYSGAGVDVPTSIMLYSSRSSFNFFIEKELTSSESKKVVSNCDMYRLISPNYQGAFDFNLAKNGGKVNGFNVFCTYKPYTPLIKVAPDFNWLYGGEFGDNRGLICGGDFSLPRSNNAWQTYLLNNKNYQNIFNREIQHLDFEQGLERRNQLVSGAVAMVGDAAKGAMAGAMVGGGWGAVIGGALGLGASATGYAIDAQTLAKQQQEAISLAVDKFNYQLGNIKALPNTLTKVGAFDAISKYFPTLEYYTCTDTEKEAFKDKIKYESMTVMRIGVLINFIYSGELNYFKGRLIRNDEIMDDTHTFNAIYEELAKGVYI